jgi:hypothetical protein
MLPSLCHDKAHQGVGHQQDEQGLDEDPAFHGLLHGLPARHVARGKNGRESSREDKFDTRWRRSYYALRCQRWRLGGHKVNMGNPGLSRCFWGF